MKSLKNPKPGLRTSVNAKCKDCIFDNKQKGSWLQQVTACTDSTCPLFLVRPISKEKKETTNES